MRGGDSCTLAKSKLKHLTVREAWCFILDLTSDLVPCKMGKFYTRVCDIATGKLERNIYHTYELIDDDTMLEMSCFGLRDVVKGWRPAHSKDANETAKYSSYKVISTTPRRSRNQPTLPSRLQSRP